MKMNTKPLAIAVGAFAIAAAISFASHSSAQEKQSVPGAPQHHMGHAAGGAATIKGDTGPASQAYNAANAKMHKDMDLKFSGNADVDFARGMIPHHRGAIDMARVVLQYGRDPQLRKLAEDVVKAQESEIAFMTEWLKKNGAQ